MIDDTVMEEKYQLSLTESNVIFNQKSSAMLHSISQIYTHKQSIFISILNSICLKRRDMKEKELKKGTDTRREMERKKDMEKNWRKLRQEFHMKLLGGY